jgi:hypothetical protein
MDLALFTLFGQADAAAAAPLDLLGSAKDFVGFATTHWRFCLLHFLEFAVWGAWFVVLGNMLNARGFSRTEIGRIYSTMPIGSMIAPLFMAVLADKYFNTEILIAVSHIVGGILLFMMARTNRAWPFFWMALFYAVLFSPTLSLVNSIVFAHDADIFGGKAEAGFPWIRVFGTLGWIAAGLSHTLILKKDEPVSARPMVRWPPLLPKTGPQRWLRSTPMLPRPLPMTQPQPLPKLPEQSGRSSAAPSRCSRTTRCSSA